jgi:hypothetical protein
MTMILRSNNDFNGANIICNDIGSKAYAFFRFKLASSSSLNALFDSIVSERAAIILHQQKIVKKNKCEMNHEKFVVLCIRRERISICALLNNFFNFSLPRGSTNKHRVHFNCAEFPSIAIALLHSRLLM